MLILFSGHRRLARGPEADIAPRWRAALNQDHEGALLVIDGETGRVVDLDPRDDAPDPPRRGRPKLGVVGREVTLLPRHWDWLAAQPGGASAALRRLVEQARRAAAHADIRREARDVTYRFLAAIAGDLPGFEEAVRALFAGDAQGFAARIRDWPPDIQAEARQFAIGAFDEDGADPSPGQA